LASGDANSNNNRNMKPVNVIFDMAVDSSGCDPAQRLTKSNFYHAFSEEVKKIFHASPLLHGSTRSLLPCPISCRGSRERRRCLAPKVPSHASLGHRPRNRIAPGKPSAESAIHVPEGDSRFQRWRFSFHESWGVAPGSW
jgi:hypothetical protein